MSPCKFPGESFLAYYFLQILRPRITCMGSPWDLPVWTGLNLPMLLVSLMLLLQEDVGKLCSSLYLVTLWIFVCLHEISNKTRWWLTNVLTRCLEEMFPHLDLFIYSLLANHSSEQATWLMSVQVRNEALSSKGTSWVCSRCRRMLESPGTYWASSLPG